MSDNLKHTPQRSTMWTFLLYQESAPENYVDILNDLQIPWIVSPLHGADLDKDGNIKKPHWHAAFFFDSLKSYKQVSSLVTEYLKAPSHVQIIHSTTGFFHYLTHAENPEKAQYSLEDIQYGAGFNLEQFLQSQNIDSYLGSIIDLVETENIKEFSDLVTYARQSDTALLKLIINRAYFFSRYLDSKRHSRNNIKVIDHLTELTEENISQKDED
ncbi:TPA: replication protein [Streptococcus suis]|nr:replication protein [Streptococcus suis]